jgi:hypothetical protein
MDVCLASWASFWSFVDVLWMPMPIFEARFANSDWLPEVDGPAKENQIEYQEKEEERNDER